MKVVTADETGLLKVVRVESGASLATAGPQAREHAVGGMCHAVTSDGELDYATLYVARRSGIVDCWRCEEAPGGANSLARTATSAAGAASGVVGLEMAGASSMASCTEGGSVAVYSVKGGFEDGMGAAATFSIGGPISAMCCAATGSSARLAAGGRENGVKCYDLETQQCVFRSKNLPHDFLDLAPPVWVTAVQPIGSVPRPSSSAARDASTNGKAAAAGSSPLTCLAVGTAFGQLHLYDTRAARRPVRRMEKAAERRVTALLVSQDSSDVIVGDAAGELHAIDLRAMRQRRRYPGPAGSIRALSHHPNLDVFASVGLDRTLRLYDFDSGESRGQVYLRQRLTHVLFCDEGVVKPPRPSRQAAEGGAGATRNGNEPAEEDDELGSEEYYDMGEAADFEDGSSSSASSSAFDEQDGEGGAAALGDEAEEDGSEDSEDSEGEDGAAVEGKRRALAAKAGPGAGAAGVDALAAARERFKRTRR